MVRTQERGTLCDYGNTDWRAGRDSFRVRWAGVGRVPSVVDVPAVATSCGPWLMGEGVGWTICTLFDCCW